MRTEKRILEEIENIMDITKCSISLLIVSGVEIKHVKSILSIQHPGRYFQLTETNLHEYSLM